MTLAPPTVANLATFTGRESSAFGDFALEALAQATLLFYLATTLTEYPEDDQLEQLAKNGIMDMADKIYLNQPYKEASSSPFQSETIGSYSYSKMTQAVKKGDSTGVTWFDLAVSELRAAGQEIGSSGSIQGFEWDGIGFNSEGKAKILGASDSYRKYVTEPWPYNTETYDILF